MNDFNLYFEMGWRHIMSWDALDHLLFILCIAAPFSIRSWKKVVAIVTAFTIGHAITLALSVYEVIRADQVWTEFLIAVSIVVAALLNILKSSRPAVISVSAIFALCFGLVHGLGFAETIRFMLAGAQHIVVPLLAFNIGLEAGQIVVIILILLISLVIVETLKLPRKWWLLLLSLPAFLYGIQLAIKRWPFFLK